MNKTMQERFENLKLLQAKELELQRMAVELDDIPVSYELISSEWLTKTVCSDVPGAKVVAHSLDTPDEGTSNRRRIFLQYNDAGIKAALPASVFCKATQSLESRKMLGLNGCAEGEVNFYNQVRPLLDIEAPVGIFANVNAESLNSIIILQDMQGQAEFCNHKTTISLEKATSQMALLAKVHGRFYESPELETVARSYGPMENFYEMTEAAVDWMDACRRGFLAAKDVIPERLFKRAKEIGPVTTEAYMMHGNLPRTFIHNDVHLKNWYIAANGEMGLNDWQCCVKGHWSRDLAYAMSTALTVENRRAWGDDLIKYYLRQLSSAGGPSTSFDDTMRLYRQQLFAALAMWTGTLTPAPGAPPMQPPETSIEFIKRITHAINDLDALDSFS